jgi:hypothetical protein
MIVQAINSFTGSGDIPKSDIIILTPGGGVGPNSDGCKTEYGTT